MWLLSAGVRACLDPHNKAEYRDEEYKYEYEYDRTQKGRVTQKKKRASITAEETRKNRKEYE